MHLALINKAFLNCKVKREETSGADIFVYF